MFEFTEMTKQSPVWEEKEKRIEYSNISTHYEGKKKNGKSFKFMCKVCAHLWIQMNIYKQAFFFPLCSCTKRISASAADCEMVKQAVLLTRAVLETYSLVERGLCEDTQTNSCDVGTGPSHDRCHHSQELDTLYLFYPSVENLWTQ